MRDLQLYLITRNLKFANAPCLRQDSAYFNVRIMKVCAYIFQDAGTVVPAPKRAPHPSVGVGAADTTIGRSTLCKR